MKKQFSRRIVVSAAIGALCLTIVSPVFASAATSSANTQVNATLNSVISITTNTTVALNVTPTPGGAASSSSDTVTVATNNATGYNLSLADTDSNTNLVSGANSIAAHTGTFAAPTTLGNNSWGYRVDNAGGFGAGPTASQSSVANLSGTWAGVAQSGAAQTLKTTSANSNSDTTTVNYGVKVDTTKPSGTYSDQVTYTAVTN